MNYYSNPRRAFQHNDFLSRLYMANTVNSDTKKKKKRKEHIGDVDIVVLGLSHHTAPVHVREKLAIPEDGWNDASRELCSFESIDEAAILSTCNRFEIYMTGRNEYEAMRDAIFYLQQRTNGTLDEETLRRSLFVLSGEDAIWHLMKVTAGLDSIVVGEQQILTQVKRAYTKATEPSGSAREILKGMIGGCLAAGRRVRAETGISRGAVSISSAAVEHTTKKLAHDKGCASKPMKDANVVVIGAGKMARLLLINLSGQGITDVTVVNRSPESVEKLRVEAPKLNLHYVPMEGMWDAIASADVVYPCTSSPSTLVNPEDLSRVIDSRKRESHKPLRFFDISVPRNVHPDCGSVEGVECYNVDDLKKVMARNTLKRQRDMAEVETILQEEMGKYLHWQESLGAEPIILRLQEKAETLRQEELQRVSKKLGNLSPDDVKAVDSLSKGIVAKLLHGPMHHLKRKHTVDTHRVAISQLEAAFQL
eukprot:CAMPEP_0185030004 /NCGR_PEP_ID=MMETSP1103-20130426/16721_1 /TAXON_ID=36769 /ORGANISM="Paraphysomonas bandaiensis, Strain Caron Lab Isolate" /LENGTH=478 /DNA_ID=CAMNT_0027564963 /DNA_START=305 /DNA_END=1741 /DNA_ORIENTATION=-